MKNIEITKKKFEAWEKVRKSGMTNMFAIVTVRGIADEFYNESLTKQECFDIMRRYSHYKKLFGGKVHGKLDELDMIDEQAANDITISPNTGV